MSRYFNAIVHEHKVEFIDVKGPLKLFKHPLHLFISDYLNFSHCVFLLWGSSLFLDPAVDPSYDLRVVN